MEAPLAAGQGSYPPPQYKPQGHADSVIDAQERADAGAPVGKDASAAAFSQAPPLAPLFQRSSSSSTTPRPAPLMDFSDTSLSIGAEDSSRSSNSSSESSGGTRGSLQSRPGGDSRGASTVQPGATDLPLLVRASVAEAEVPDRLKASGSGDPDNSSLGQSAALPVSSSHSSSSSSTQAMQAGAAAASSSSSVTVPSTTPPYPAATMASHTPDPAPEPAAPLPPATMMTEDDDPTTPAAPAVADPAPAPAAVAVAAQSAAAAATPAAPEAATPPHPGAAPAPQPAPRRSGCRDISEFELLEKKGEGVYGVVMRARDPARPGSYVALKRINLKADSREGLPIVAVREIKSLRALAGHPNVMGLNEVVTAPPSAANRGLGDVFLSFEYADTDLSKIAHTCTGAVVPGPYARMYLHQLLRGLAHLHACGWLHRDLKPENLLVTSRNVLKIGDMGMAQVWYDGRTMSPEVVSPVYRAPEIILGDRFYGPAADVWAVGVIMVQLYTGMPLSISPDTNSIIHDTYKVCGAPNPATWPGVDRLSLWNILRPRSQHTPQIKKNYKHMSPQALDLLERLLTLCPARRITAAEALAHPFFTAASSVPLDPAAFPPLEFAPDGRLLPLTRLIVPGPMQAPATGAALAGAKRGREEEPASSSSSSSATLGGSGAPAAAPGTEAPDAKRAKAAAPAPAPVPANAPKFGFGRDALNLALSRAGGAGAGLPRPGGSLSMASRLQLPVLGAAAGLPARPSLPPGGSIASLPRLGVPAAPPPVAALPPQPPAQ